VKTVDLMLPSIISHVILDVELRLILAKSCGRFRRYPVPPFWNFIEAYLGIRIAPPPTVVESIPFHIISTCPLAELLLVALCPVRAANP